MVDEQKGSNNKREIERLLQRVQPGMPLPQQERLLEQLQAAINYLITQHFDKLVQWLYTVDVDEKRLKSLLKQRPEEDAAKIIAELLMTRQLQKMQWRQQHSNNKARDDNEESW